MTPTDRQPVPISELPVGERARLHRADVDEPTARLLCALGLTSTCELRLCKTGEPCIIQVRSTRIGISDLVARRILVVPVAGPAPSS
jgi:Fe2+ transport system protein FeoA